MAQAREHGKLLELNANLIGLPASAGHVEFVRVDSSSTSTAVLWRQVRERQAVPGAGMVFVFDLIGRLVEIENHTLLQ